MAPRSASPLLAAQLVLVLVAAGSCHSSSAHSLSVQGTVRDATTGRPVVHAEVLLGGGQRTAFTDGAGAFSLPTNVPEGTVVAVAAYAEGYSARLVGAAAGSGATLGIALTPALRAPERIDDPFAGAPQGAPAAALRAAPAAPRHLAAASGATAYDQQSCIPYPSPCHWACEDGCAVSGSTCGVRTSGRNGGSVQITAGQALPCGCDCSACPANNPYTIDNCPQAGSTGGGTTGGTSGGTTGGTSGGTSGGTGGGTSGGQTNTTAPALFPPGCTPFSCPSTYDGCSTGDECPGLAAFCSAFNPPPPPQQPGNITWVSASGSANDAFGYIAGCLVYADTGAPAGPAASDINFYVAPFPPGGYIPAEAPVPLQFIGIDGGNGLQSLVTVAWSAYQGGRRLTVGGGSTCLMRSTFVGPIAGDVDDSVALFIGDPNTAVYAPKGTASAGWLVYYASASTMFWKVDSLDVWTVGRGLPGTQGGCGQGQILNACDGRTPVPFYDVRVNSVDPQGTRAWTARTDARGQYCVATPIDGYWPGVDQQPQQLQYFLSGTDILATNMCDPFPDGSGGKANCRACDASLARASPDFALCTLCDLHDPADTPTRFTDTCAAPPRAEPLRQATIAPCTFCADGNVPDSCSSSNVDSAPVLGACAPLATGLGRAAGCSCLFVDQPCNPLADHCCYVAPYQDPNHTGQGGCGPTNGNVNDFRCHQCTKHTGEDCDPRADTCCDRDAPNDPSVRIACEDGICVTSGNVQGVSQ